MLKKMAEGDKEAVLIKSKSVDHINLRNIQPNQSNGKVKHRRAKSVARAEDIQSQQLKVRKSQPDKPCHRPRDSLFSWTSGFDNFTGLVNWAFLLLSLGAFRLLLENFIKYGIRVDPRQWFIVLTGINEGGAEHPSLVLILYSVVPIVISLVLEKGLSIELIPNGPGCAAHIINLGALIALPVIIIHIKGYAFSLIGATSVCMIYSVLFLKLWSYIQTNGWCRMEQKLKKRSGLRRQSLSFTRMQSENEKYKSSDDEDEEMPVVEYPDNLTLNDIFYFCLAPTLCYELNFPKTTRIRKRFLIKRIIECVFGFQVILAVLQQYMVPSIKNSLIPFSNMEYTKATERLLKLAIPNHLAWLCFFYIMFHSLLNLIGEIMHFADRNFYCDWWNATNIDSFWRNWNMPVHRWAVRHVYIPIVDKGYSKSIASISVFFISAFFHEYLVSIPLKTFKIWAFMGMMGQIPLSYISRYVERRYGPRWGNVIVWGSLIIGQPLAIMMYYHDYVITHYGNELLESYSHL